MERRPFYLFQVRINQNFDFMEIQTRIDILFVQNKGGVSSKSMPQRLVKAEGRAGVDQANHDPVTIETPEFL